MEARGHRRSLARRDLLVAVVLAVLAYVPLLARARGRVVADTKLYLTLSPAELLRDAPFSWDAGQFAGWVPHQAIQYLWPAGPWFWALDRLGVPAWIAQRLWMGTILFAAGTGVYHLARRLGLARAAAAASAVTYMLSPYVLPYVSRTSVILLPWAAVGWITGLTVTAARRPRGAARWREPALIALIVLTVGGVNLTSILMIVPAPVLWLAHAAWERLVHWRTALMIAVRIAALSVLVSLWWLVTLAVQGRYGADVLDYSELVGTTTATSSSTEVLRGLGYWLFYVHDGYGFTTTAAVASMRSGRVLIAGGLLLVIAVGGLALTSWRHRRFAVMTVFVGVLLAVSAHTVDDPSPLTSPLVGSRALQVLRSSTRAVALSNVGLALGTGIFVAAAAGVLAARVRALRRRADGPRLALLGLALVVAVLAVLNLPALTEQALTDPALAHAATPPAAWSEAAAALDAGSNGGRVLLLPGQESASFRWGYTVDPVVPAISDTPYVARDWLPLGSAAAMDLLYAFDDRFQAGVAEPEAVAAVAGFLGVSTIWLAGDENWEHFRTPRPGDVAEVLAAAEGVGAPQAFGEPQANPAQLPSVDERDLADPAVDAPLAAVSLFPLDDPPTVMRAAEQQVVVAGSGDGIVDAAAAGLLRGDEAVIYAADAAGDDALLARTDAVVVTDSNRARAHHWRSSQDVTGFTESGGPDGGVLVDDEADHPLPVFGDEPAVAEQTTATLDGDLVVRASMYGEPFAYRPEHRPAMAVDGSLDTAWLAGIRGEPEGEFLEVSTTDGTLTLVQPQHTSANRMITRIRVEAAGDSQDVDLDGRSLQPAGQEVTVAAGEPVRLTIVEVAERPGGRDPAPSGVGFADLGVGTHDEVVGVPAGVLRAVPDGTPAAIVLSRLRTSPLDRWRSDPEPRLIRELDLPADTAADVEVTLRLHARAADEVLDELAGRSGAVADRRLLGDPRAAGRMAFDGDPATAWTSPFDDAVGSRLTADLTAPTGNSLAIRQPLDDRHSLITAVRITTAAGSGEVVVPAPGAEGWSTVEIPAPGGGPLQLEVTAIDTRWTYVRRYEEGSRLPAAIIDVDGLAVAAPRAVAPPADCRTDLLDVDGRALGLVVDAAARAALLSGEVVRTTPCDGAALDLRGGEHRIASAAGSATGIDVDRIVLTSGDRPPLAADVSVDVERARTTRTATVGPCPNGCWLIMGEGYNRGWAAESEGRSLGPPIPVSGGFNGWWLEPSAEARTVEMRWTPQRAVNLAIAVSCAGVVLCVVFVVRARRAPPVAVVAERASFAAGARLTWRAAAVAGLATVLLAGLVARPSAALLALGPAVLVVVVRRPIALGAWATALVATMAGVLVARQLDRRFRADFEWPSHFEDLHPAGMLVVVLLLVGVLAERRSAGRNGAGGAQPGDGGDQLVGETVVDDPGQGVVSEVHPVDAQ